MAEEPEILNPQKERDWTGQRVAHICGPISRGIARAVAKPNAVPSARSAPTLGGRLPTYEGAAEHADDV